MYLRSLKLTNFKCYHRAAVSFSHKVICIHGLNGSGKTNLLDAIYFICIGKSYFNPVDKQNIRHGEDFFRLEADIQRDGEVDEVVCINEQGKRKKISINGVGHRKMAEHIGRYPVVVIAPDDVELINGGSEERRRFVDFVLSFTSRPYLEAITQYNKLLQQRNSLLKRAADKGKLDETLLQSYDQQLPGPAEVIYTERKGFIGRFTPLFSERYQTLATEAEAPSLQYHSDLHSNSLSHLLRENRERDRAMQRTTSGIHRDDLNFVINGEDLKKYGSQGQKKSFLVALKLAQYSYLEQFLKQKPVLLLDDIFDKLDENRSRQLLRMVTTTDFGQVFITDTSGKRLREVFADDNLPIDIFEIRESAIRHEE